MNSPILDIRGLSKIYEMSEHKIKALSEVHVQVMKGDFIAVMGPSGSGKTTLLALVGCLDKPSRGKIILDGIDVTKISEASLYRIRREKIGFIFQSFNLIGSLSAVENVELPMECLIRSAKQRREKARELLRLVGLQEREKHRPAQLSAGEQQRVAIARALANDPVIVLADEPTGNLDSETGLGIVKIMNELTTAQKCTVIMVTHDPRMASLAGRVFSLRDGRLVQKEEEKRFGG